MVHCGVSTACTGMRDVCLDARLDRALAAVAVFVAPAAEAKVKASLAFRPAQPIARQPVRVTMRTDVVPSAAGGRCNVRFAWP